MTDILDESLSYRTFIGHSSATVYTLKRNALIFLKWLELTYFVVTADRLRKTHLHAYQQHLHDYRTRQGLPLKANAVNCRVKAVKALLRHLRERNYIAIDLERELLYVKTPKLLPTSVLTHSQIRRELNRIDISSPIGYRDRTIMELLYSTGIRNAELVGIQLHDVDLVHHCIKVKGKGDKERMVPVGKTAMRYLEGYIKGVRPFLPKSDRNTTALWLNRRGNAFSQKNLNDMILMRSRQSKLSVPFTPHTFRRSCTTELIRGGANPRTPPIDLRLKGIFFK